MDKIFVQIASYRDAELIPTIKDCLLKAKYAERLTFGICFQHDETESLNEYENDSRFKIISVHWTESKGLGWARNKIRDLWDGEKYTLQLDSHMRFAQNWDEELIEMFNQTGVEKPILTSYPASYNPITNKLNTEPPSMISGRYFTDFGTIHLTPESIKNYTELTKPIPARFVAGGYNFTLGIHCKEYKYDPQIYFRGDEISLSLRSYTLGYDLFHPHKVLIWHEYVREGKPKHWSDFNKSAKEEGKVYIEWNDLDKISEKRIQTLLRQSQHNDIDLGDYNVGNVRSFEDYENYAGIKFSNKKLHSSTIKEQLPPINDFSNWWDAPINIIKKVSCVMTTYRRFNCVERSIAMFLSQICDVETELIIYNTDVEHPLALDETFSGISNIKVINNNIDFETKQPYNNVGSIRRDAITFAAGDYYITWDDDDLFFPWNIQQCMDGINKTHKLAWKPKESYMMQRGAQPQLQFNNMEASFLVSLDGIKKYGFDLTKTGAEHLSWLSLMSINREICIDETAIPGYCFYWADDTEIGGHKQSNNDEFNRPDNFERHKEFTTDYAKQKITKKELVEYKEIFKPFRDLVFSFENSHKELYYKYILKNISKIF
jgi:hypothetical protein